MSSECSNQNIDSLKPVVNYLVHNSISNNTHAVYNNARRSFETFRCRYALNSEWPPPTDHVINYIAYLFESTCSPSTARSYLSGLSFYMKSKGFDDVTDNFIVRKMLEGFQRCKRSRDLRAPITWTLLSRILSVLPHVCRTGYEALLFSAAYLLAFFAFLRVSEIAISRKTRDSVIRLQDISFGLGTLNVTIRYSKNDQLGKGVTLCFKNEGRCKNLFATLKSYIKTRPNTNNDVFLIHADGSPVTSYQFSAILKKSLNFLNIASSFFRSHSFRIGAATQAFIDGLSESEIQTLGRWKSKCFSNYIRVPAANH